MKKIYGIGIGPGDPELITIKSHRLIRECDKVFVPCTKAKSTAQEIAAPYIEDKEVICLDFPMGEDNTAKYKAAAKEIDQVLKDGEKGVFLTLGDALVYSTYAYLMKELQLRDIDVETFPGITAFNAAASCVNMPLTIKDESFYLCDGTLEDKVLEVVDTICILKVNSRKEEIIDKLEKYGFDYLYVKRCSQEEQKILCQRENILKDNDYMSLILAKKKKR